MATDRSADPRIPALEAIRRKLAVASIRMTTAAASGHPSTCLSCSHLLTALYFGGALRIDPGEPDAPDPGEHPVETGLQRVQVQHVRCRIGELLLRELLGGPVGALLLLRQIDADQLRAEVL